MKRWVLADFDGIEMPNGEVMKTVAEEGYRYLGSLDLNDIMHHEMKDKFRSILGELENFYNLDSMEAILYKP